jgi:hypothetical protein
MSILVPYETTGQQLGETRQAMTKTLMKDLEKIIEKCKDKKHKYYVLVHAKPWPKNPSVIKIKMFVIDAKCSMMLSCMLFGVDNSTGTLTLEWALPGDWPTWAVGGTNEPVPETVASISKSGIKYHYDDFFPN